MEWKQVSLCQPLFATKNFENRLPQEGHWELSNLQNLPPHSCMASRRNIDGPNQEAINLCIGVYCLKHGAAQTAVLFM